MRTIWLCCLIIILLFAVSSFAQESEYQIKAVFLEQFTRFVEWPDSMFLPESGDSFIIGVLGENPFDKILEKTYANRKIQNKNVQIRYIDSLYDMTSCHILFISRSFRYSLNEIISITQNRPILTVSDTQGFAEQGVLINFYHIENKMKFEINEKAVHESGLEISYILFNLAKIVNPLRGEK